MVAASRTVATEPPPAAGSFWRAVGWCRREPLAALLAVACLGVLVYLFGGIHLFYSGTMSAAKWSWNAWNSENNQEHSRLVLPIFLFLVWYHRRKLAVAKMEPWNPGLGIVIFGVACFVLAARSLQPRIAIVSLPIILLGAIAWLWGREVARILLFPCAFLLFMVPIGFLVTGTVWLQLFVTSVCNVLASVVGMKIEATGTTIRSLDGSFNFEIAEGCSGIHSLMAMSMLTALFVHFTQREWWKKGVIFAGSIVFAVIGNIGRIFTVILFAKFINARIAGGLYHDYSGFIFFPIAVMAMAAFAHLVNLDWPALFGGAPEFSTPSPGAAQSATAAPRPQGGKAPSPVSYDY